MNCNNALLSKGKESALALVADGATIGGSVILKGVKAVGDVRFLGARVANQIQCLGSIFENPSGYAFEAALVKVEGTVFLNQCGFAGIVNLHGAQINGNLEFDGAQFAKGTAVVLENAAVQGTFIWSHLGPDNPVLLDLVDASVGPLYDEEASWPQNGELRLDGFVYRRFATGSPTDSLKRLEWLGLQGDSSKPQPYMQLATVLHALADDAGVQSVLITMEDRQLTAPNQAS